MYSTTHLCADDSKYSESSESIMLIRNCRCVSRAPNTFTWNEQGNTSVGPTVFAKDSIEMKNVKLLLEHDKTRPIGKLADYEITDSGITARFVLAKTFSADDALEEAATGLRDGFSVGAQINEWTNNKGVMQITSATLDEVSLGFGVGIRLYPFEFLTLRLYLFKDMPYTFLSPKISLN